MMLNKKKIGEMIDDKKEIDFKIVENMIIKFLE